MKILESYCVTNQNPFLNSERNWDKSSEIHFCNVVFSTPAEHVRSMLNSYYSKRRRKKFKNKTSKIWNFNMKNFQYVVWGHFLLKEYITDSWQLLGNFLFSQIKWISFKVMIKYCAFFFSKTFYCFCDIKKLHLNKYIDNGLF